MAFFARNDPELNGNPDTRCDTIDVFLKGHWQPKFLLLISIRYTYGIFNFIFWPVCRV
jgi:hypothetical protein